MNPVQMLVLILLWLAASVGFAQDDVADVPSEKRRVDDDERKSYFVIRPVGEREKAPAKGFGLLIILPGGDGSAGFHAFVKRIRKNAVPDDIVVAQPIAVKWTPDQQVVWPTEKLMVEKQKFSTEEFVEDVIKDVKGIYAIDPERVFCMGWSSSGPAVYALALRDNPMVKGSYVAMSVYKPKHLPPIKNSKGRSIYIEHSPDDRICTYWMAQMGYGELKGAGARTTLVSYKGGHGWRGNVYGRIRKALDWLQDKEH